jgi:hypothetical protein
MKPIWYVLAVTSLLALMLIGGKHAAAQPQPQPNVGGGLIAGNIYGFDMFDELQPIAWATVNANNGATTFTSYSGGGGFYEMYVPSGLYNVTVVEPGYVTQADSVAVANGSSSSINFYLEQSHVPVPEFPTELVLSVTLIVTLCAALLALRRSKRIK